MRNDLYIGGWGGGRRQGARGFIFHVNTTEIHDTIQTIIERLIGFRVHTVCEHLFKRLGRLKPYETMNERQNR
jgi:hypothetical protein